MSSNHNNDITITIPPHIGNIFNHSSGKRDYLKNTFDDREMNLEAFYELNFQIYKNLLKEEKYDDEVFLEVKRNLYYLEESGTFWNGLTFYFSDYFLKPSFFEKELAWRKTTLDVLNKNLFFLDENNIDFVINFLKKNVAVKWDFIKRNSLFLFIFKKIAFYEKGLIYILSLNIEAEFKELLNQKIHINKCLCLVHKIIEWRNNIDFLIDVVDFNIICDTSEWTYILEIINLIGELLLSDEWFKYLENRCFLKNIQDNWRYNKYIILLFIFSDRAQNYLLEEYSDDEIIALLTNWTSILPWPAITFSIKGFDYIKKIYKWSEINLQKQADLLDVLMKDKNWIDYLLWIFDTQFLKGIILTTQVHHNILWKLSKIKEWIKRLTNVFSTEEFKDLVISHDWVIHKNYFHEYFTLLYGSKIWREYIKKMYSETEVKALIESRNKLIREVILKNLLWVEFSHLIEFNTLSEYEIVYFCPSFYEDNKLLEDLFSKPKNIDKVGQFLNIEWATLEYNRWEHYLFHDIHCSVPQLVVKLYKNRKNDINLLNWKKWFKILGISEEIETLIQIFSNEQNNLKNQLTEFITTSDSGSCLLSWYRWTWKTSLLKSAISEVQNDKKYDEDIVEVIINIPEQKKDEKGENKSFSKNELITKIIREIYLSLKGSKKSDWSSMYWEKEIENFSEQYIRTFNNIENTETDIKKNELVLNFVTENLLLAIFSVGLILYWIPIDLAIKTPIVWWLIIILWLFVFKINYSKKHEKSNSKIIKDIYNDDIAENKLNQNIRKFTKNRNRKLVIVIDELDKLLDLDKKWWSEVSMSEIFDVLWKLKTLFFDNSWAVFFVVTNKDAYNYYLENRHNEDDLISNIFNKVLYLPMTRKENFNLNRTFKIEWEFTPKVSDLHEKRDYLNQWLYYKSHGNWRKWNFILNQKIEWNQIKLSKKEIEYDKQFYDFMDILYDMFFDETKKKFLEYIKPKKSFYIFVNKYLNVTWRDEYKLSVEQLSIWIKSMRVMDSKSKKIILANIESLKNKYTANDSFDTFSYMFSSVDKISGEPAYRDYIMNNILNIIELLKHDRSLRLEDIFPRLKFVEIDFKYPAFEDLILIWIPFMIYYFDDLKK